MFLVKYDIYDSTMDQLTTALSIAGGHSNHNSNMPESMHNWCYDPGLEKSSDKSNAAAILQAICNHSSVSHISVGII